MNHFLKLVFVVGCSVFIQLNQIMAQSQVKAEIKTKGGSPSTVNTSFESTDPRLLSESGLKMRDPFKLPEYLLIKIRQKKIQTKTPESFIDENAEPIRRWPLANYVLVGIIWDVQHPKAMFQDKLNQIHVLSVNEFIGSNKGVITKIESGSVTVIEGKIPQVIRLKK